MIFLNFENFRRQRDVLPQITLHWNELAEPLEPYGSFINASQAPGISW